jgi:hypothetical protein
VQNAVFSSIKSRLQKIELLGNARAVSTGNCNVCMFVEKKVHEKSILRSQKLSSSKIPNFV